MTDTADLLKEKKVLITGGSRGIGFAIAKACLDAGAQVVYFSRKKSEHHDVLEAAASQKGGFVEWISADVSDESSIEQAIQRAYEITGTIDVLINNAGITKDGLIFRMSRDDWDQVLSVNLTSAFFTCRRVARQMAKQKSGAIINISSVVGISGNGGQTNYSASKAGLIGFSKSLAKEVSSRGIRVNVIAPGFIETEMTGSLKDEQKQALLQQIPLGSFGSTEDVAHAVLFLASDMASYITGQVLVVDGGMLI